MGGPDDGDGEPADRSAEIRAADPRPADGAQSIRRALTILRIIAEGRDAGVSLSEVARVTEISRPTVHRIVRVLLEEGVVERKPRSRRYAIGEQVPLLALARSSRSPLLMAAQRPLDELSQALGDTLFLTIRTGLDTLCVARRIGPFPIQVISLEVGTRRPLGVSSAGIALLSLLPSEQAADILERNRERFKRYRATEETAAAEVAEARRLGFCIRNIGLVPGTKAISVAFTGPAGSPQAALTLAAVQRRLTARREWDVVEKLRGGVGAILAGLGGGKP
ncbi:IclR family transcriptional regulator [Azospirillum endophyticum]